MLAFPHWVYADIDIRHRSDSKILQRNGLCIMHGSYDSSTSEPRSTAEKSHSRRRHQKRLENSAINLDSACKLQRFPSHFISKGAIQYEKFTIKLPTFRSLHPSK